MLRKIKTIRSSHCLKAKSNKLKASAGFTLIEMIVSLALFSFVMLATTTVLMSVIDANRKAQGLKTAINNVSLALESMVRNLRTGTGYSISGGGSGCQPQSENSISFTDNRSVVTTYSRGSSSNGGFIQISKDGGAELPMTAPEINIDRLCFYIDGQQPNDNKQPRVLITVGGIVSDKTVAGAKARTTSRFDIETFVSQRFLDIPQN